MPSSVHNDTTGKQGGTTSEYYHLTAAEYAGTLGHGLALTGDVQLTGALGIYELVAGAALSQYNVVYLASVASAAKVLAADGSALASARGLGVLTNAPSGDGQPALVATTGIYGMTFDIPPTTADFGKPVYLSATPGTATLTALATAGQVSVCIGKLIGSGANAAVRINVGETYQL